MNGNLQLRIPAPCREDWAAMRPEEKGRFCSSCSKTVVDFSTMTDREVIAHLAKAGQQVCGKFAPEQLARNMTIAEPDRQRRRGWWHWLVAGLLVSAEAKAQTVTKEQVVKVEKVQVLDTVEVVGYGKMRPKNMFDGADWIVKSNVKAGEAGDELCGLVGGLVYNVRTYRLWQLTKDTLAAVGLAPKRELEVYPNPVRRGGAMSLQWQQTEAGSYEVDLFNGTGMLVERHKMEVGGKEQVDLLSLPPALPAGMYFLRVSRPGAAKVITLKIIVV